jgi:hypothetical protein
MFDKIHFTCYYLRKGGILFEGGETMAAINMNDWYTFDQALEKLNDNRKTVKEVDRNYIHSLVRYGKIHVRKVGRSSLYLRKDVDSYVVEERGEKSGRAAQARSTRKKPAQKKEERESAIA